MQFGSQDDERRSWSSVAMLHSHVQTSEHIEVRYTAVRFSLNGQNTKGECYRNIVRRAHALLEYSIVSLVCTCMAFHYRRPGYHMLAWAVLLTDIVIPANLGSTSQYLNCL